MHKILRWLLVLSTLIMTNLQGQEIDFANRFSLNKFNKRINKEIDRQIRRKGYKEMRAEGIERYFIYNLSRNDYATWESLRDYSFLDSCELRPYMDFDGKDGDLRIGGPVFAYLYRPIDSMRIGYLEGKQLGKANISENVFNSLFLVLREHRMDYLFICPVRFPDGDYGASTFGIKNNKIYKIYSVKDWERHTYTRYYILYDPVLGRMLSPDIAIQDEYNQQAYNRYTYCLNNPLRFTDPSGYFVRGSRNYYDWSSFVYYDFGNYRNNGSAFNTDLSEGKLSPVYDIDGVLLGTTKEGFTGRVLVYEGLEDMDFSSMTEQEALLYEGVESYDNIRNSLSKEARSNIWTNIVSHFDGLRVYDEKISMASITDNRIGFGGDGFWNTYMQSERIKGSDLYPYETTVENIASSIIVHEWYSHLMKRNGDKMRSHRLAYKNVINYKLLWDATTEDYKAFNLGALQYYTLNETGRDIVDKPYRRLYNLYYGKCFNNPKDYVDKCLLEYATDDKDFNNEGNLHHTNDSIIVTYVNFSRLNKFLEYSINYSPSNNCLTIHPVNNKNHVMIVQDDDKQKFISFIDEFYISKKSTIIEHKTLKDERVEYDIPCIRVSCFIDTSRTIYSQTYLGDGEYELVFSPSFMDFQKLLIKLINEYDRNCINPKPPYRCRYY